MSCGNSNARHWFAYWGSPGTSAPECVRFRCGAPNPNYDRDRDPYAEDETTPAYPSGSAS